MTKHQFRLHTLILLSTLPLLVGTTASTGFAAAADGVAHTKLTDGLRASGPDDSRWLTLFADSTQLPKTTYNVGEFSFWGFNYPHNFSPTRHPAQFSLVRDANIKGVRYDVLWAGIQQQGPDSFVPNWGAPNGVEDDFNLMRANGFSIQAVLGYTPAWANGMRSRQYPPLQEVNGELVTLNNGIGNLANDYTIIAEPDVLAFTFTPENPTTQRYENEIMTTNFAPFGAQVRTIKNPVIVGTEQVWVDEEDGNGWALWTRVDNIINSPDNAKHYMFDLSGRVKFRDNRYYYNHGRTPKAGSNVMISYDAIVDQYYPNVDLAFDNMNGTVTALQGSLTGHKTKETFSDATLSPEWTWMNPPANWDVNTTSADKLTFDLSSNGIGSPGHFLYQSVNGTGDWTVVAQMSAGPQTVNSGVAEYGITVYQDASNWFRYGISTDAGRPHLTQCINGQIFQYGLAGQLGFQFFAPRYLTLHKIGNKFYILTQTAIPFAPTGQLTGAYSFTQNLSMPLKIGIGGVGVSSTRVQVDTFEIITPRIGQNDSIRASYAYLDPEPFADFCRLFVNYYKTRVKHWEIYNEPDQNWVWRGGQDIYAILLREAAKAIHETDPDAKVLSGGYADSGTKNLPIIYNTIGNSWFDYVAWHPYVFSNKSPDAINWAYGGSNLYGPQAMAAGGDANKEVFFGELATGSGVTGAGGGLNDWKQAEYGARLLLWSRKLGYPKAIQWWPVIDMSFVGESEDFIHGGHEGVFYRDTTVLKPMYWMYRNAATNKGIWLDLGSYDTNNNLTPAAGYYPLKKVVVGVKEKSAINKIRVLTSLTNTHDTCRPPAVATRHIGQAGAFPFKVTVASNDPDLKHEGWTMTAISPLTFEVVGAKSGIQGIATIGLPFASLNGVASFTIPIVSKPYVVGDKFVFETFAGDTPVEVASWTNSGESGSGDVEIMLPADLNARYVTILLEKASQYIGAQIDEVQVYSTSDVLVSANKLYVVDGYQNWWKNYMPVTNLSQAATAADGTRVQLNGIPLYLKWGTSFGYIEQTSRSTGLLVMGNINASEGELVNLKGAIATNAHGQKHLVLESSASAGSGALAPMFTNNRSAKEPMATGLYLTVAGKVLPGSITASSYVISDGSDTSGIKIKTKTAPAVAEGDFVSVSGASAWEGERVIYEK